jgi:cation:H+ antiporter
VLQPELLLVLGLALLLGGGNWFVDGAAGLARLFGVRPLIIGVIVIGFGTSAPEMLVSLFAVVEGKGGIAVGNIVGSNIANVGLVMALAAIVFPLAVERSVLRKELLLTILITFLFGVLVIFDGRLDWLDGSVLLFAFAAVMVYITAWPRRTSDREVAEMIVESPTIVIPRRPPVAIGQTLLGLALILVGANLTVDNAATIARQFGISEAVIGLTLVAVGTSLPELVAAIIAAWKRETDLIVGNVLGSNIYNLAAIGGLVGVFSGSGLGIEEQIRFESILIMGALTLLLLPLLHRGSRMDRVEGVLVAGGYLIYTVLLF